MPRTCKWCGKTASYGRLCDCANEMTLAPVTDTRAALVAECDASRAEWKAAKAAPASLEYATYAAYLSACRALVEHDRDHPEPEPTDGPR